MIWLLRHGDAEDAAPGGGGDEARRLTGAGVDQARAAGRALVAMGVTLDACFASPRLRALDTARLVCESLAIKPAADDRLAGGDFDPAELAAGHGEVLLVGHEPDFSRAIQAMTGARVKVRKGGLAAIDGDRLVILMCPADLS